MTSTPITLKTLGKHQRVMLLQAREGAIKARDSAEQSSAMRLHGHGLLERGRGSHDWWITPKGEEVVGGG